MGQSIGCLLFIVNRQRRYWIIYILWCVLLVVLNYGVALKLPFLADDFFQFPFVDRYTLSEIWHTAIGLYYFRPLAFTVWKLFNLIFGSNQPVILHAFNLLIYWISGLLVGWLADRLWSKPCREKVGQSGSSLWPTDWRRRFVVATLFLLFPFHYEAVPWIAAGMHLLATVFVLSAIFCYMNLRMSQNLWWVLPVLVFIFLAPFAHEIGILTVILIFLIELTDPSPKIISQKWIVLFSLMLIPVILWWLIWRQSPATVGTEGLFSDDFKQLAFNTIYTAQGSAYPISWLGMRFSRWSGSSEISTAALLSVVTLVFSAWVQLRTKANRRAWLPWLWILITSLPAILSLPFAYLSASPRVLMLPSVGIVWLWADVGFRLPQLFPKGRWSPKNSVTLVIALMILLLIQNLIYVQQQMRTYMMGGSVIDRVVETTTRANKDGFSAVFVNLPAWLAPPKSSYAIGEEGAMLMPARGKLAALVYVHTGQQASIEAVVFHDIRDQVPYHSGLLGNGPKWNEYNVHPALIYIVKYEMDEIFLRRVGQLGVPKSPAQPIVVFDEIISLLGANAFWTEDGIEISLIWRVEGKVPPGVTVFVHAVDQNGQLIAQGDGDPIGGTFPFSGWELGMVATDIRTIATSDRNLSLQVGLYERNSGKRLNLLAPDGTEFRDQLIPLPINPPNEQLTDSDG